MEAAKATKKQKTNKDQDVSSSQPMKSLLLIESFKARYEECQKKQSLEVLSGVKTELEGINEKIGEKIKNTNTIIEELLKIHLASRVLSSPRYFHEMIQEHDIQIKVFVDLKIVIEDFNIFMQQTDRLHKFRVGNETLAMSLTKCINRKHELIKKIRERKEAEKARNSLQKMVPALWLKEINQCDFRTSDDEKELEATQKLIDNFDFKKGSFGEA